VAGPLPPGDPAPADGLLPADVVVDARAPFGVYLHVPFCRVRCGYCDFNTYTATELRGTTQAAYADTVLQEVALARRVRDAVADSRPAHTVFFGGGTPTLLPPGDLARMLDGVREAFGIEAGAEITVEANPDTLSRDVADDLAAAGVTRVSIGMQSSVPHVLATLDRTHDPRNVATAVAAAREASLDVSLDLIYGTPGESLSDWERSLETALALRPDHLSAYALIVEDGTPLARRIRRGELEAPDGFSWYEISNWARSPHARSEHNLGYWRGGDWWGFGPGAHSHVAGVRWWNVKHPAAYAQRLAAGTSPAAARERPEPATAELERVLLRTRISEGLPIDSLAPSGRRAVAGLIADGLVDPAAALGGILRPTLRGRLLADAVVRTLVAD
jgi:putative oxygen-independent coproporphyrinogen III oxidase